MTFFTKDDKPKPKDASTSPNGTRVLNLTDTITDSAGLVWKFAGNKNGKGWPVVREAALMGTRGIEMLWWNGSIAVRNGSNLWVAWGGTNWLNLPGDPSAGEPTGPVNCELTEEFRLGEFGPWSSCQPDGFQHRTETWVKDIIVPPSGGGADCGVRTEQRIGMLACQYVPPSGGVITYIVLIGEHAHQFTDVPEMQSWVARFIPLEPEPVACGITWRDYAGVQQQHQTATFAEFQAYIAAFVAEVPPTTPPGGLAFPGQAKWREVWPNYHASDLTQAPAGWVSGDGYPERRAFCEGQWWFSTVNNIDASRHLHVGAAVPDKVRGIFEINVRIRTFHWEAFNGVPLGVTCQGLYSVNILESGVSMMAPAPISEKNPGTVNIPITQHVQDIHIPVRFNSTGALTDGWKCLTLRVDLFRTTDQIHHLITMRVPVYLDNGGGRPVTVGNDAGEFMASGWMTEHVVDPVTGKRWELNNFNYIEPSVIGWNPSNTADKTWRNRRFVDDVATSWGLRGSGGTNSYPLDVMVTKNPDWHAHPPVNGSVKVPITGTVEPQIASSKTTFTVPASDFVVGDRMVVRISDRKKLRYAWVADAAGVRSPKRLGPGETVPEANKITLTDPDAVACTVLVTTLGKKATT